MNKTIIFLSIYIFFNTYKVIQLENKVKQLTENVEINNTVAIKALEILSTNGIWKGYTK